MCCEFFVRGRVTQGELLGVGDLHRVQYIPTPKEPVCGDLNYLSLHIAERVCNSSGPTPAPLSPLEQLKHDLSPPVEWQTQSTKVKSGGLLHLPERITSLERSTDLYSGKALWWQMFPHSHVTSRIIYSELHPQCMQGVLHPKT